MNPEESESAERTRAAAMQMLRSLHQSGVRQLPAAMAVSQVAPPVAKAAASEPQPVQAAPAIQAAPQHTQVPTGSNGSEGLRVLAEEVAGCTACEELCSTRTQTVFGVGDPNARLCFLGEAPGADEDRLGEPFVGKAGQLLTRIIQAMGLRREDVYILNILKCRPPNNRNPLAGEVANCRSFFERQLDIIQPEYICCLGSVAAQNLLDTTISIGRLRGKLHDWNGKKVLATYHPAYLLREPDAKKKVWEDMKFLLGEMGLKVPGKG